MKIFLCDLIEWFLNYIVAYIPFWRIRKFFYLAAGMKMGKKARILMGLYVRKPWKVSIGYGTVINEKCFLDGRGGLEIGDNVAVSAFSKILTASHDSKSNDFAYFESEVIIEDYCWIGLNTVILPGVKLAKNSILAAGSTLIKQSCYSEDSIIYSGVPAKKIGTRNNVPEYEMWRFKPWFK